MSTAHTPGSDYAQVAFNACQQGRADENQQRSVAATIILLHGIKGELLKALQRIVNNPEARIGGDIRAEANAAINKVTGSAQKGSAPLPPAALAAARAFGAGLDAESLEQPSEVS